MPHQGSEYIYEVEEACRCLREGLIESTQIPLAWTLDMMDILDGIRQQIGLIYPVDKLRDLS